MSDITGAASIRPTIARGGAFYRLVWKWHFLASLYVLPFMAVLSITGGLYLYKPQIENWLYADRFYVEAQETALPIAVQVAQLDTFVGISRMRAVIPPVSPEHTTRIEFNTSQGVRSYAWINPYTAKIIAVQARDTMLMHQVKKFHGELLLGDIGTKFVELAAHWAVIMLVTGAVLWWPRGAQRLRDRVALPRLPKNQSAKRGFWRQMHLFTGMLAVVLVLPILVSGLPWTDVWGGGLNKVQEITGTQSKSLRFGGSAPKSSTDTGEQISIEQVAAIAAAQGLATPYEIRPPRKAHDAYWMRSASVNRYAQSELVIDQYSGSILARVDFTDNPGVAQAKSLGISFHQGELYGWANVAQNTVAAVLGVVLSVSGFVAWWMRRPRGSLGVPAAPDAQVSWPVAAVIVTMMILLPLVGASLIAVLALDWFVFRKLGWFRGASAPHAAE